MYCMDGFNAKATTSKEDLRCSRSGVVCESLMVKPMRQAMTITILRRHLD